MVNSLDPRAEYLQHTVFLYKTFKGQSHGVAYEIVENPKAFLSQNLKNR